MPSEDVSSEKLGCKQVHSTAVTVHPDSFPTTTPYSRGVHILH